MATWASSSRNRARWLATGANKRSSARLHHDWHPALFGRCRSGVLRRRACRLLIACVGYSPLQPIASPLRLRLSGRCLWRGQCQSGWRLSHPPTSPKRRTGEGRGASPEWQRDCRRTDRPNAANEMMEVLTYCSLWIASLGRSLWTAAQERPDTIWPGAAAGRRAQSDPKGVEPRRVSAFAISLAALLTSPFRGRPGCARRSHRRS